MVLIINIGKTTISIPTNSLCVYILLYYINVLKLLMNRSFQFIINNLGKDNILLKMSSLEIYINTIINKQPNDII